MSKPNTQEFEVDNRKVRLVKKWMNKGLEQTNPSKRELVTRGVGSDKEVVGADVYGAIQVGHAKGSTNYNEVKNRRDGDEFFWRTVRHLDEAYLRKYNGYIWNDVVRFGRDEVVERIQTL